MKRVQATKVDHLKVADYMTHNPVTVTSDASLPYAVKIMAKRGIGNLIVIENGKTIGLITEREILQHLIFNKEEIRNIPVKDEITKSFARITPSTNIIDAAKEMISKKVRLLVFDNENLLGVVTASDLVRAFKKTGESPSLEGIMSKQLFTMRYDDTIFNAIKIMYEKRIGSVVITKNGKPYGIFTERDLPVIVLAKDVSLDNNVGDYCSSPLITTTIGVRAKDAAEIMSSNNVKRLPITSDGKLIAIVTARDLVEAFQKV
ncbi:MAG: CBS domain-containing protein [Nitrososphaerales archaeon]